MTHPVKLDVFEGPLDLLLHLVSRERVDVADVSISSITDEFLSAMRKLDQVELEAATSFLLLAATLIELKTVKLLPRGEVDDPDVAALLEERDRLLHRLIEYSTFKGAADALSELFARGDGYHVRTADLPQWLEAAAPDLLAGVTPGALASAASSVMSTKAEPQVDVSYVAPVRVSLREAMDAVSTEVSERGKVGFSELCREAAQRIEVVVRFLALLELFKQQSVDLEQTGPFGEIMVRWREPRTLGSA